MEIVPTPPLLCLMGAFEDQCQLAMQSVKLAGFDMRQLKQIAFQVVN